MKSRLSPWLFCAAAVVCSCCFDAAAPSQEKTPAPDGWDALREQIARPRDEVSRIEGTSRELPLPLTPDEVRDPAQGILALERFETRILREIDRLAKMRPDSELTLEKAESALSELWSAHMAWRLRPQADGADPFREWRLPIEDRLADVRLRLLRRWQADAAAETRARALRIARVWLRLHGRHGAVGDQVRLLWMDEGLRLANAGDGPGARLWLNRLLGEFGPDSAFDPLRNGLRRMADGILKQATDAPPAQAQRLREQARLLAPESIADLPPLAAGNLLAISSRSLPRRLTPGTARSDDERRCVDLLYRPLREIVDRSSWNPLDLTWSVALRSTHRWSDGAPVSAADVRHSLRLLESAPEWRLPLRELLANAESAERGVLRLTARHASLGQQDLGAIPVVPRFVGDKELASLDDPAFAKSPKGCGPFVFAGMRTIDGRESALLRVSPYESDPPPFDEIRWTAHEDFSKAIVDAKPSLAFDLSAAEAAKAKAAGYAIRTVATDRCWFLACNQRRAPLADAEFRKGLAYAVDRNALLTAAGFDAAHRLPLRGPFPSDAWASAAPPQVPESLHQPDLALSHLRKAGEAKSIAKLTISYCRETPDADALCKGLASQLAAQCAKAGLSIAFDPRPLAASAFEAALDRRDYDLAYVPIDRTSEVLHFWSTFDRERRALEAGGSNFLGASDARLESLFRAAIASRRFPAVRDAMHNVHAHLLDAMPLVPLWQAPERMAHLPTLDLPAIDPRTPFANLRDWKRPANAPGPR